MQYKKSGIYTKQLFLFFFIAVCLIQLIACAPKKASYLQGDIDSNKIKSIERKEAVIQKHDILSITVFSDDPTASAIYNQSAANTGGSASGVVPSGIAVPISNGSGGGSGYLVNDQGD